MHNRGTLNLVIPVKEPRIPDQTSYNSKLSYSDNSKVTGFDGANYVNQYAKQYGVNPSIVKAVMTQESSLGNGISNHNVMQVNGMDGATLEASIKSGISMLSSYLKGTGDLMWSLAMYNMGPGIYSWAKQQGINDPKQAMVAFRKHQMEKPEFKKGYGDANYIDHVLRYYS